MEHKRRALAVILATLLMTLGVHGAAQATLIPTLGSVNPSGGNTFVWTYDIGLAFPPDWVGDFEFNVNQENPPGAFLDHMVTQYECALQKPDPGRKYDALANNIDTFVYGSTTRRLSNIDLGTVWLG